MCKDIGLIYIIEEQFDKVWDWIVLRNRTGWNLWCNARHIKTLTVFVHMCKHLQYNLANPVSKNPDGWSALKTFENWSYIILLNTLSNKGTIFGVMRKGSGSISSSWSIDGIVPLCFYVYSNMNMFSHLQHTFHAFLRLFPSDPDFHQSRQSPVRISETYFLVHASSIR